MEEPSLHLSLETHSVERNYVNFQKHLLCYTSVLEERGALLLMVIAHMSREDGAVEVLDQVGGQHSHVIGVVHSTSIYGILHQPMRKVPLNRPCIRRCAIK